MYETFFHLHCRPFDLAPDPKFVYMTGQHSRAIANIRFALMNHDSFVIITGGLKQGDLLVTSGAEKLRTGAKVRMTRAPG